MNRKSLLLGIAMGLCALPARSQTTLYAGLTAAREEAARWKAGIVSVQVSDVKGALLQDTGVLGTGLLGGSKTIDMKNGTLRKIEFESDLTYKHPTSVFRTFQDENLLLSMQNADNGDKILKISPVAPSAKAVMTPDSVTLPKSQDTAEAQIKLEDGENAVTFKITIERPKITPGLRQWLGVPGDQQP